MKIEALDYSDGDVKLRGYLADPLAEAQRPGILVVHEAPGLDDHPKMRARMLAELGYVALAVDMYGADVGIGDANMPRVHAFGDDRPALRRRIRAGLDALLALPQVDPNRIAAIGYCFGGMSVLELARDGAQIAGVVAFHGLLMAPMPAEPGKVHAKVLALTGSEDVLVPPQAVQDFEREMSAAGADWTVITYGGAKHAFTNPNAPGHLPGFGYSLSADRRAWAALQTFLVELFGLQ